MTALLFRRNGAAVSSLWTISLAAALAPALAAPATADSEMSLSVIQPAYRNSIYATETRPRIAVRAEFTDAIRGQVAELRGRLLDEQRREVLATKPGLLPGDEVRFDAGALPVGVYSVDIRALAADGRELASGQCEIRKLPPSPGSEVRIDEHRNIVVDGAPSVQIGWYGAVRLDDPRPEALALQNIQTASVIYYPDKSPVAALFRERGIRTMVNLEPARLLYTFELWRQPNHPVPTEHTKLAAPSAECREMLRKMIELLKDEPGLFGWYIADEPEINHYRADYLEAFYHTLRELDPYHPVVVTNDTLDGIEKFGYRACDILAPDPYGDKPSYVPSFLARANSVMRRGQGLMLTPWHAAHHTHFSVAYGSQPPYSYRVMRGQYLATLAAGGRGFAGYASDFFLPEPRLRIGLPHLWREVRFLAPAVAAAPLGKPLQVAPNEDVLTWIVRHGPHTTLIVMNSGATRRRFAVRHAALTMPRLSVISEGREVTVEDTAFHDDIPAGEASIYSTDPRGLQLPTVAQIESEIAELERSAARPGNLLHASRGVKARASQGTTPWFAQIFYYAINGIDDDEGWHVTHADLPQWIELSLPAEASIRRVVVRTPNLRDYDLQFRAADGATQQAEVRGNALEVAEHVLVEPVRALKLRLVARAVRDASNPPRAMVREIEAYADAGSNPANPLPLARIQPPADPLPQTAERAPQTPPLWVDNFSNFRHKPRHYEGDPEAWALDPAAFVARYDAAKKRLDCTAVAAAGYASMSRLLPYDQEHRFFQIDVPRIEGEGYRWLSVSLNDPSGKVNPRAAVHSLKPGRYTVDTHALHDIFRSPQQKQTLVNVYVMKGIDYAFSELRLAAEPTDGLAVTMADGSPLPRSLKAGDELLFRLFLEQPATDAVVELERDSWYGPVRINGEPYVQLLKSGREKDGRYWSAVVKIGPQTDKFHVEGYPVLFRAAIHGGAIKEALSTLMVDFE